jgi:hypothetical protein
MHWRNHEDSQNHCPVRSSDVACDDLSSSVGRDPSDRNFLTEKVDRIDLGPLKGNDGDQNYVLPAGIDLTTYKAVAFFCERFNANFGTVPLEK